MEAVIKSDLGRIFNENLLQEDFNKYTELNKYMQAQGYNTEYCDICAVKEVNKTQNELELLFKFVHYTVRTMETEDYYRIVFYK